MVWGIRPACALPASLMIRFSSFVFDSTAFVFVVVSPSSVCDTMNRGVSVTVQLLDPTTRQLLKVTLDDALSADEIFTILMSEGVEARREYIEQHALEVTNLDV